MNALPPILVFIFTALLAYYAVGEIRRWLQARRILDIPNQRSAHATPTPRGGGLAIVILALLAALGYTIATRDWLPGAAYLLGGAVIAFLGFRDDVRSLSTRVRFLIQGLVALGCILAIGPLESIHVPLFGELRLGWFAIPISLLWIVGLTNAYNFMDGIDGISGGVALAAGLSWVLVTAMPGGLQSELVFWTALVTAAASLGFLGHNWAPARIFIGDVASTFLGFTFAVFPLLVAHGAQTRPGAPFLAGTAILWIYIFDAGLTFLRRLLNRERVFSPHRTHLYQRMAIGGTPVPLVSALYSLLTLAGGGLAAAWLAGLPWAEALLLPGMPIAWITLYWLGRRARPA